MANKEIPRPAINDPIQYHPAEHQIFLSFNGDSEAEAFFEWIQGDGWTAFTAWCKEHQGNWQ